MPERRPAPIRVLFNTWADRDNVNSQSLTAREIACRLDSERFLSSLFLSWRKPADSKVADRSNVRIVRVPPRLGSLVIARELLWGAYDIVFYPNINGRASRLFQRLRGIARHRKSVDCVETSLDQIEACPEAVRRSTYSSLRQADLRSAITPAIARDLQERLGLDCEVVPLGVDLDLFQPIDRAGRQPPWRVLYVASIQPRKQTHLVLELARRFRRQPLEFVCIGPALGDASYFQRLVEEKKRDDLRNVTFLGALSQQEIYSRMRDADVYLLPSRLEGFGKTTLEAAATGLPAIVFADYETTAVVDRVTGFQVETLEGMEEALHRLITDPDLRRTMGRAACEHSRDFSWSAVARRWETVFTGLIHGRQGPRA